MLSKVKSFSHAQRQGVFPFAPGKCTFNKCARTAFRWSSTFGMCSAQVEKMHGKMVGGMVEKDDMGWEATTFGSIFSFPRSKSSPGKNKFFPFLRCVLESQSRREAYGTYCLFGLSACGTPIFWTVRKVLSNVTLGEVPCDVDGLKVSGV